MNDMLAARLHKPGEPLTIEQIPVPVPAPHEVLVEVETCGLCGTDINLTVSASSRQPLSPMVLPHLFMRYVPEVL